MEIRKEKKASICDRLGLIFSIGQFVPPQLKKKIPWTNLFEIILVASFNSSIARLMILSKDVTR